MSAFRLASHLGKTLSELDMDWDEFVHWQAFLSLEPPEKPAMQRTAALMAQITNMSGRSLKDKKTVTAEDFLGGKTPAIQTAEEQIAFLKSLGKERE